MSTLGERLKQAREGAGFDTAALAAERVGVPYHTYAQHENGTRGFRADKANLYARAFGVDPLWLLFGRGDPAAEGRQAMIVPQFLPVRYQVQAGHWFEVGFDEPAVAYSIPVLPHPRFANWRQWLELVVGDSVNQKYAPGAYVHVVDAIEMGYAPRDGDFVVVERQRDGGHIRERTIKQIELRGDEVILWPRSTNARWQEPVKLTDGARDGEDIEVEVVGLVIGSYSSDY